MIQVEKSSLIYFYNHPKFLLLEIIFLSQNLFIIIHNFLLVLNKLF